MRGIKKPENNIDEIVRDCVSTYRDDDLKRRFASCVVFIEDYTAQFECGMEAVNAYTLSPHENVGSNISKSEMQNLYADKFSRQGLPGRKHYDRIKISAPQGRCPLCAARTVTTLDHYMGKSLYPALAISPVNLVPACRDCNITKGEKRFFSPEDMHLHPYFDETDDKIWLQAEVCRYGGGYDVFYKAVQPDGWSTAFFQRVHNHFELFKLQELYCLLAADEISGMESVWRKTKAGAGIQALYQYISDIAHSCGKISPNSWKSALYRGVLNSQWFMEDYL